MFYPVIGYQILTDPDTGEVTAIPIEDVRPTEFVEPPWRLIAKLTDPADDPEYARAKVAKLAGWS
jgi:hypothetical protein